MKILIVGGRSSLGRALKPVLLRIGDVITVGRKDCDINFDLNDSIEKIKLPDNIDVVINTAAHFGGKTAEEVLEAENVNVLGTLKLCQAAVLAKAKQYILISSMSSCVNKNSEYYGIYSLSKKHSEEIAQYYCSTHSLPLTILRPSQIYGNEDYFRKHQPFLYTIIDRAEKGENITIYGSRDALRNYIYIDDLTNIILKVVQKKIKGTYSCTYPTNLTYSQIAKAAISAFGSKGRILFLKDKPDIPDNIFKNDNSLYKKIDFYPQITIKEGMLKIALFRRNRL